MNGSKLITTDSAVLTAGVQQLAGLQKQLQAPGQHD
jgi:hypothetical protein